MLLVYKCGFAALERGSRVGRAERNFNVLCEGVVVSVNVTGRLFSVRLTVGCTLPAPGMKDMCRMLGASAL
jgi:hypothetical protein